MKKTKKVKAMRNEPEQWDDFQHANMSRSIELATIGLESPDATADDVLTFLEALCEVADEKIDITEFAEKTNLKGRERLN